MTEEVTDTASHEVAEVAGPPERSAPRDPSGHGGVWPGGATRPGPVLIVLGLGAALLSLWLSSSGVEVTADSGSYLSTAQNIADGKGVTSAFAPETVWYDIDEQLRFERRIPFTEWPPLYPLLLAALVVVGVDVLTAAQVLNAAALGALAVLAAVAVRRLSGASVGVAAVVAASLLVGPVVLVEMSLPAESLAQLSSFALSDSMYLPLFLAAVMVGAAAGTGERRCMWGAIVLVAAVSLTRYVGVAAGIGAAAALLMGGRSDTGMRRAIALAAAGPLAIAAWAATRSLLWGGGSAEQLAWHPPDAQQLRNLVDVVGGWFLVPTSWPVALRVALVAALIAVVTVGVVDPARRWASGVTPARARPAARDLVRALLVAAWVHVGLVLVTMFLLDVNVPFDQRTLAPVQVVLYVLLAALVWCRIVALGPARPRPVAGAVVVAVAGALGVAGLLRTQVDGTASAQDALAPPVTAPVAAGPSLSRLPEDSVVVTDAPGVMWFRTSATVLQAPRRTILRTGTTNPDYDEQLRSVGELLRATDGVVALIAAVDGSGQGEDLVDLGGLERVERCSRGSEVVVLSVSGDQERTAELLDC